MIEEKASFRESVEKSFEQLIRTHGFRMLTAAYDRQDFGNTVVVLESESVLVRVVRDRGQVFVEIASVAEPGNWYPLDRVIEATAGSGVEPPGGTPMALEVASSLIEENYSRLTAALDPHCYFETKRELERLGELAKQRFLSRS